MRRFECCCPSYERTARLTRFGRKLVHENQTARTRIERGGEWCEGGVGCAERCGGAGVRRGAGGAHVRHRARGPAREREGPGARADAQARCPHTAPEPRFSARIPGSQATPPHCATAPRASCRENRARAVKSKRFGNPLPPLSSRTGFPTWQNARRQESSTVETATRAPSGLPNRSIFTA